MQTKDDGQEKIVVTEYYHGRLTRMREMTQEELDQERKLQTQRGMQTKARRKKIRQIIEENGFIDYDEFLDYVENGGDSTADLREKLEKDKWNWIGEVDKERRRKICEIVSDKGFIRCEDYVDYIMNGGESTAVLRKYLERDNPKVCSFLKETVDRERKKKIREIVEKCGFTEYEEYINYVVVGGDSMIGFRENLKNDENFCVRDLRLEKQVKKKKKSVKKTEEGFQIMSMAEMSRLILGLRKLGLGDKELADFLLWVESGDAKYEPGQLGGQQEEGQ